MSEILEVPRHMTANGEKKTSIHIDDETSRDWMKFVIDKTGSVRRLSEEMKTLCWSI